jgi:hypothetical protein
MQGIDPKQLAKPESRPFVELHRNETEWQERELVNLDSIVGQLLEEIGAMLPITGEGCPLDGSLPSDPSDNGIPYDGQLRELLMGVRSNTNTIKKLQNNANTVLLNLRMVHGQLVGELTRDTTPGNAGMCVTAIR